MGVGLEKGVKTLCSWPRSFVHFRRTCRIVLCFQDKQCENNLLQEDKCEEPLRPAAEP